MSSAALLPTNNYRVAATVTRADGVSAQRVTTFATLTPTYVVGASAFPSDGMTVGVGQPIVINFNHYVRTPAGSGRGALAHHRSACRSRCRAGGTGSASTSCTSGPRPTGRRARRSRSKPTSTVGTPASVVGGTARIDDTFSIGDAHISVANLSTEEMTVTLNGATVATYPISGGRQQYPTMDGDHIVLDRSHVVHMVSSTVGIPVHSPNGYDEYVYNDVHISDSGEYVHAAPWSVGAQGRSNVSHGCINMSDANSLTFFNFSRVGDVVEVVGGPRPPAVGDHGVMDWSTDWSQWTPVTVHQLT